MESFTSRNTDAAIDLLAEDATWWVAGHPEEFPLAASLDKAGLKKVVDELLVTIENGLAVQLLNISGKATWSPPKWSHTVLRPRAGNTLSSTTICSG